MRIRRIIGKEAIVDILKPSAAASVKRRPGEGKWFFEVASESGLEGHRRQT